MARRGNPNQARKKVPSCVWGVASPGSCLLRHSPDAKDVPSALSPVLRWPAHNTEECAQRKLCMEGCAQRGVNGGVGGVKYAQRGVHRGC